MHFNFSQLPMKMSGSIVESTFDNHFMLIKVGEKSVKNSIWLNKRIENVSIILKRKTISTQFPFMMNCFYQTELSKFFKQKTVNSKSSNKTARKKTNRKKRRQEKKREKNKNRIFFFLYFCSPNLIIIIIIIVLFASLNAQ